MKRHITYYAELMRMAKNSISFRDSARYWADRYRRAGNSGEGSYGELALFKADILNEFVRQNDVRSVIEFGCGDGNQLSVAKYPNYTGVDITTEAVLQCRRKFAGDATKKFLHASEYSGERADLALSLDVIFHLVEDNTFDGYMRQLFGAAAKHVVIYSSNSDALFAEYPHVRHREFSAWVERNAPHWSLTQTIPNLYPIGLRSSETSFAHFFVYALK
jgi:SAM-dependent methyltransferase